MRATGSIVVLLLAVAMIATGCAGRKGPSEIPQPPEPPPDWEEVAPEEEERPEPDRKKDRKKKKWKEVGLASWYGKKYHKRKTASGERYDMYGISAAHRTLPFGTVVKVTNLENGKTIKVRINDRGPFIKGRIIDLSYGAAKKIDMVRAGVVRVRIEVVSESR
jgi:rare lipoprotein A